MERKQRTTIRPSQNIMNELDQMSERTDCRSRSEFIEKTTKLYDGYIRSADGSQYLPIALSPVMNSIIHTSEGRIAKVLYKNTVELPMLMNILAATAKADEDILKKLRKKCVEEVNGTRGQITLRDTYRYQKS